MEHGLILLLFFHYQLRNWENLPNDKPAFTVYSRLSGQEWFFLNINKDSIRNIVQVSKGPTHPEDQTVQLSLC